MTEPTDTPALTDLAALVAQATAYLNDLSGAGRRVSVRPLVIALRDALAAKPIDRVAEAVQGRPDKTTYEYAHKAYLDELELRIAAQMEVLRLRDALVQAQGEPNDDD